MGLFGSILGGAIGVGGAIVGGIQASRAAKKAKAAVEANKRDNQNWYDRRYNEDATQRADAQAVLTRLNEDIKQRNRAAAGAQAVMGGTDESLAATKAANNEAAASAAAQIAAAGEARKDQIEQQYNQNKQQYNDQLANIEVGRAQGIAQATAGVADAGGSIAELFGLNDKDK